MLLVKALKKYGIKNFKKEILFIFDTEYDMNTKEKEIVNESFIQRNDTYNLGLGGEGGPMFRGKKHSAATKDKLSKLNKGKKFTEETRQKLSEARILYFSDEDNRKKHSEAIKGHYCSKESFTEEHKQKISEAMKMKEPPKITLEKVTCPYCGKNGQKLAMARYHFDNCKFKK